jgi:hypothetical protein
MKAISEALVEFQTEYKQVKFDAEVKVQTRTGGSYTFEYATLAHITESLRPLWTKCGLSVIQLFNGANLETRVTHKSGEFISSTIPLRMDGSNQEQGAEISYKRRYAITCLLGVVADEDDDSNSGDGNDFTKKNTPKSHEPKKADKPPIFTGAGDFTPSEQYRLWVGKMDEAETLDQLGVIGKAIALDKVLTRDEKDKLRNEYAAVEESIRRSNG